MLSALRLLPKSLLSRAVGAAARAAGPRPLHRAAIRAFARRYRVALEEAERPLEDYASFAEFFTRRLKPGARSLVPGERVACSPVDGRVSALGAADAGRLVQAKGRDYSLAELLGDPADAAPFEGGAFATLYLSPRDYHRVHAPLSGAIEGSAYVPGLLWPVNPPAVEHVPNLFTVNERFVTFLSTAVGRVAVVMVGAACVGRIRASYDDVVTNTGQAARRLRHEPPIPVAKGDELGVFELGSTVIVLFERGRVALEGHLSAGSEIRMGEALARAARP